MLTWLDRARPDVLSVHPRGDNSRPPPGTLEYAVSSSPEPIGLHQVAVAAAEGHRMRVRSPEVLDGTPVIDVKQMLNPDVGQR